MINYELNIPFRWYLNNNPNGDAATAIRKKHKNRPSIGGNINFQLFTKNSTLLPFMVFIPTSEKNLSNNTYTITDWLIIKTEVENPASGLNSSNSINVLTELANASLPVTDYLQKTAVSNKGIYVTGCKDGENGKVFPFTIPCGYWYSMIKFADGTVSISEDFFVPEDQSIFWQKLTRIDWRNETDILGVLYQNGFTNRIYLNADLTPSKPEIIEEGHNDTMNRFVVDSIRFVDKYTLRDYVPEYVYRAFLHAKACKQVTVWPNGFLYWSFHDLQDVDMSYNASDAEGELTLNFEQTDYNDNTVNFGCGQNYSIGSPVILTANVDLIKLYPRVGSIPANKFNVINNDAGLGLRVDLIVAYRPVGGCTIFLTLFANGTISIPSLPSVSGFTGSTVWTMPYTLRDGFGGVTTSELRYLIQDWTPNPDYFEISVFLLWGGQTVYSSTAFGPNYNLFRNDSPPINADNIECIAGTYYAASGSGNYLVVTADGNWTLNVINPGGIVYYEDFLVQYRNNSLSGATKWQMVTIEWVA